MKHIDIIVGTESGNAQMVAEALAEELDSHDIDNNIFEGAEDFELQNCQRLIICCATHGEGDMPENIENFYQQLKDSRPSLNHINYGVIALGDSSYDDFCQAGKNFNRLFNDLGATCKAESLLIDAQTQPFPDDEAVDWLQTWLMPAS